VPPDTYVGQLTALVRGMEGTRSYVRKQVVSMSFETVGVVAVFVP
jgi:hypothetical protein